MVTPQTVSAVLRGDLHDRDLYLSILPLLSTEEKNLAQARQQGFTWAEIADMTPSPHRLWDQMAKRVAAQLTEEGV